MTDRWLDQMLKWQIINKDEEDIYRFGLEGMKMKAFHYTTYLIIAVLAGELWNFLMFFAAFSALRKNAGGCYLFSCLTVGGFVLITKTIPIGGGMCTGLLTVTVISDMILWRLSTTGNRNRELDEEEIEKFKKRILLFLLIENVVLVSLILLQREGYAAAVAEAILFETFLVVIKKLEYL